MRALLLCSLLALAGCARVLPHERGRLMQRTMQPKPALDDAFDVHVHETRESAVGATSGEGASCGCR